VSPVSAAHHLRSLREVVAMETNTSEFFTSVQLALPKNQMVIANARLRILSLLDLHASSFPLLAQERFSANEWGMLLVLLQAFPYYVSYAQLNRALSDLAHKESKSRFDAIQNGHIARDELRSIREVASNLRLKVRPFGLEITANRDLGYQLTRKSLHECREADSDLRN
jgi:hypothetical protein